MSVTSGAIIGDALFFSPSILATFESLRYDASEVKEAGFFPKWMYVLCLPLFFVLGLGYVVGLEWTFRARWRARRIRNGEAVKPSGSGTANVVFGVNAMRRALDSIDADVAQKLSSGSREFTVVVQESDFPVRSGGLRAAVPMVVNHLQSQGLSVIDTLVQEWSGVAYLSCRANQTPRLVANVATATTNSVNGSLNLLPSDNIYTAMAMKANETFGSRGWQVRVAAVRMLVPGQLDIAMVVPTNGPGTLGEALEMLPGHQALLTEISEYVSHFGHEVQLQYFGEDGWPAEFAKPVWQYHDCRVSARSL